MIDGVDGTGKATQTRLLVSRLASEDIPVQTISFPQYDKPSSGALQEYLRGTYGQTNEVSPEAASILFAVDRFDGSFRIKQWLAEGSVVIADRFVSSNMGHQGSKFTDRAKRQRYLAWEDELEFGIMKLPRPTQTIVLTMPAEISFGLARQGASEKTKVQGDIHEQDMAHLKASEETYREIASMFPHFHLIDCAPNGTLRTREEIHEEIWRYIKPHVSLTTSVQSEKQKLTV